MLFFESESVFAVVNPFFWGLVFSYVLVNYFISLHGSLVSYLKKGLIFLYDKV